MRKWLFLCTVFLSHLAFGAPIQDRKLDPEALSELAFALGLSKEEDLVAQTQKSWLRNPGRERWELSELSSEKRHFVLDWAEKQGIFAPWRPAQTHYGKALILGATTCRMQIRLNYLKELWEQGTRFDEIVWLTGDRPLDPRIDGLTERCKNESEAAQALWKEANLPPEMKNLPVVFIAVPMKEEGSVLKRPNTEDTIVAWLEQTKAPCTALFVSDQPFCGYQFAVIKACLPEEFLFDLVGQGVDPKSHPAAAAITLDSIARWLYQESLSR